MNYQLIYNDLISSRKLLSRSKKHGIFERHHIIPTAVGGEDTEENTVLLTPREHFIAHVLLWKANKGKRVYRDPIFFFKKNIRTSRAYDAARKEHIMEMKTNNPSLNLSEEAKLSKSKKLRAHIRTPKHCENISIAAKGKQKRLGAVLTDVTKTKIGHSLTRHFAEYGVSDETRQKISVAMTGKIFGDEFKEACKKAALARVKKPCTICGGEKVYDGGNLAKHMKTKHKDQGKS